MPLARRRFLASGATGLLSTIAARRLLAGTSTTPKTHRPASRCILLYLLGGPPHIDMWDPKPLAPAEIRGPFQPISTAINGVQFTEHLPKLAQRANRLAVLRSLTHDNNDHPFMIYYTLTGRLSPVPLGANTVLPPSRGDDPHIGAIVAKTRHRNDAVPGYVAIPEVMVRMAPQPVSGGGRAGFLGAKYDPLAINDDPTKPIGGVALPEGVTPVRLDQRQELLAMLDGRSPRSVQTNEYGETFDHAVGLTRTRGGGLFEIDRESAALRERYGRDRFGQSLLLARRLVERGVSFVGVHFNYMTKCDGWDTHKQNFAACEQELLPMLDRGLSALLDDLADRGLLEETLVVTMGEFGRTPKVNADAGRDHWGPCGGALFAGGPIRTGQAVGSSDRIGAYPASKPVGPPDVTATIFQALGLDPRQTIADSQGRPIPISTGQPIAELL